MYEFHGLKITVDAAKGSTIWEAAEATIKLVRLVNAGVILIFNEVQVDIGINDCEGEIVYRYYKIIEAVNKYDIISSNSGEG